MSYQVELSDRSTVEKDFSLKIEPEVFDSRFQKELSRLTSQAHLKGFRPGRAPRAMVAKMYGDRIHSDIVSEIVNDALRKTVDENKLSVVGTSDFSMDESKEGEPISVRMVLSLYPEPKFEKIEGLDVEVSVRNFKDKDLEDRLGSIREMFAETVDVEDRTTVEEGDLVVISYVGEVDGVLEKDLQGEKVQIELGKNQLPEDIEKALIGISVGETREILHALGKDAPVAEGAEPPEEKEVLFKITLDKIQKKVRPEFTDELAKKTGVAEDVEGLKAFVEKDLRRNFDQKNRDARDGALVEAVIAANEFEVPQALLDREIRYMLAEMKLLDPSQESFHQTPVDQYREVLREQSLGRVKRSVAVEQLLLNFEINPGKEDVDTMLSEMASLHGVEREELNREYGYPGKMDNLIRFCAVRKVTDILAEKMSITEKEMSEEEDKE
jgi:trigger factor